MKNNKSYFYKYVWDIAEELKRRNIKFQVKYLNEISIFSGGFTINYLNPNYPEHNNRYLTQCYFNLQEKYDRGIITKDEWHEIEGAYYKHFGED